MSVWNHFPSLKKCWSVKDQEQKTLDERFLIRLQGFLWKLTRAHAQVSGSFSSSLASTCFPGIFLKHRWELFELFVFPFKYHRVLNTFAWHLQPLIIQLWSLFLPSATLNTPYTLASPDFPSEEPTPLVNLPTSLPLLMLVPLPWLPCLQLPGKLLFVSHCPESLFTLKFSLISLTPSEELIAPSSLVLQYLFANLHCIFKEYLFLSHCLLQHCDQQAPSLVYFPQIFAELNYIVLY